MAPFSFVVALLILLLSGCDSPPPPGAATATTTQAPTEAAKAATPGSEAEPRTLNWDDLMPADFEPEDLLKDIDVSRMNDNDPQARELMAKLRQAWDEAPVVAELDGVQVRLPGFVVPLETDGKTSSRFLLVPYIGACIHVPPPPLNQTVLVEAPKGASIQKLFEPVWVTGRLTVQRANTKLANAGYTLTATMVDPYQAPK